MRSEVDRRSFIKRSALGTASVAALGAGPDQKVAALPLPDRTAGARSANTVRIAAIQVATNPKTVGLATNPFRENFSERDLHLSIDLWLNSYDELFARAAEQSCKLAVVTEDFTHIFDTAMFLDDRAIFQSAVDKQTSLVPERVGAAAKRHRMYIVACYFSCEANVIHNVSDLFGPDGDLVGRYRKVHMPQYEKWQVTPGDHFPAFETEIGWIGMLICYDQMWPESAACCTMNGAQLICHPSAAVFEECYMKTRAGDNQVHYLSSTSRHSMISSPRAEILADGEEKDPSIVWADVDLVNGSLGDEYYFECLYSGIQDHKERHLKFRRPEAYQIITDAR
ncbi:MAG: carbon-nitrogen hydrolase family protein, partial [bacterium]